MSSTAEASSSCVEAFGCLEALPDFTRDDIVNRVEDAKYIARVQSLSRELRESGRNVRSLRFVCLDEYHERARNEPGLGGKSFRTTVSDGSGPSTSAGPSAEFLSFKEVVGRVLESKPLLEQLRIEVEPKMQSKSVGDAERRRTDFWLTDHFVWSKWLQKPSRLGDTLQHLCIVDYGQQAILRRSGIIKLLSEHCKLLKSLDLRNLFIDTSEITVEMENMVSLTLRCVKVVGETLQHINRYMPNLQTLALLGVFGASGGKLEFKHMKVLCLGLSTLAKEVEMDCPNLEKLQLKMQCPQKLSIRANKLKYMAFNLDMIEHSMVELISKVGLQELLYGATSFKALTYLLEENAKNLRKLFLDIPCMALGEDGRFLGVLKETLLDLPNFNKLHECEELEVLSIGPGLWFSLESQVQKLSSNERWPSMKSLVLQVIPHDMEADLLVLRKLLRISVTSVVVFIHECSPIAEVIIAPRIKEIVSSCEQNIELTICSWKKSLDFSCFSF